MKYFNMIKGNKRIQLLLIFVICLLFIFTIGYSLSIFIGNNKNIANIKVNDLSFNITTNSDESSDRILYLKAGNTKLFNVIITNLNKIDTKYELIYKVCTDSKCTSYLNALPNNVKIGLNYSINNNVAGTLASNSSIGVNILSENDTSSDYYLLLDLQAGYTWNNLALLNQFSDFNQTTSVVIYIDGTQVQNYPTSCNYLGTITGYKLNQQITLKDASVTCSNNEWRISYVGLPDKIELRFRTAYIMRDYIANIDRGTNGLEMDGTSGQNLRYVGSSPRNYISFNNEMWRIIGVFTVYNVQTGSNERLIKIIRNDSLGRYSWDTSYSNVNSGGGINEWSQAKIMYELNTDYIDTSKTSGTTLWYSGWNYAKNATYDYSNNIKNPYFDRIATVRWTLGGAPGASSVINIYNQERGTAHVGSSSDGVARTNYWDGKIALMYASDYGHASTDAGCRSSMASSGCSYNNWLYINNSYQWTLLTGTGGADGVFVTLPNGSIDGGDAGHANIIRPTLFLKSDTKIIGTGTSSDPYVIQFQY